MCHDYIYCELIRLDHEALIPQKIQVFTQHEDVYYFRTIVFAEDEKFSAT